jgi:hypothetical protein
MVSSYRGKGGGDESEEEEKGDLRPRAHFYTWASVERDRAGLEFDTDACGTVSRGRSRDSHAHTHFLYPSQRPV